MFQLKFPNLFVLEFNFKIVLHHSKLLYFRQFYPFLPDWPGLWKTRMRKPLRLNSIPNKNRAILPYFSHDLTFIIAIKFVLLLCICTVICVLEDLCLLDLRFHFLLLPYKIVLFNKFLNSSWFQLDVLFLACVHNL